MKDQLVSPNGISKLSVVDVLKKKKYKYNKELKWARVFFLLELKNSTAHTKLF
jgi:hypothetical protein